MVVVRIKSNELIDLKCFIPCRHTASVQYIVTSMTQFNLIYQNVLNLFLPVGINQCVSIIKLLLLPISDRSSRCTLLCGAGAGTLSYI